ncbi:MAG: lysyl oxidase family protein [Thermomicrobiales bacterium]
MRIGRRRNGIRSGATRLLIALTVLAAGLAVVIEPATTAGPSLYPDLRTAPPTKLSMDTVVLGNGRTHYVLRFDNEVENHGGPLEITADYRQSRYVYQNVYDTYTGGTIVQSFRVGSDLIYHPPHNHFHFQDFASYQLLKEDSRGVYRGTTRRGTKTSFCIIDTSHVRSDIGPASPRYEDCDARSQGLSSGWSDTYISLLPEQWIDVGTTWLADGDYAIKSVANPLFKLHESDNTNNTALTYFTVRNGAIQTTGTPPACDVSPASGPTGTPILVTCSRFTAGQTLNIYWGSVNTTPRTTAEVDSNGTATATFDAPAGTLGNHYVIGRTLDKGQQAATLFATTPDLAQDLSAGPVGSTVNLDLQGFAVSESVAIKYYKTTSSSSTLATVEMTTDGNGEATISIPASTFGEHTIEAVGLTSGAKASVTFTVQPSILLIPASGVQSAEIGASMRGFVDRETVTLRLDGTTLGTVEVSGSGSTTASATRFTIPAETEPGTYDVTATGESSDATATATLTVTENAASLEQDVSSGPVGSIVNLDLSGFAASEAIAVAYFRSDTSSSTVATVTASPRGSAEVAFIVPASPLGAHTIEAVGQTSGAKATGSFDVEPSLLLIPDGGEPGAAAGASMRGFAAHETVTLQVQLDGTTLLTVAASGSGSTTASRTQFTIPEDAPPGPHQVVATGGTSGVTASATITVLAPAAAAEAAPTPTSTPEPTATPTEMPTATPTEIPTVEPPTTEPSPTSVIDPTPVIVAVETIRIESTSVTLRITVQHTSSIRVQYGLDDDYGHPAGTRRISDDGVAEVELDGLEPATTYHYRIEAKGSGGETVTPDATVTTAGA